MGNATRRCLQLRELFAAFIDHVDVSHRERRGKSFDPARVEIVWGS